MKTIAQRNGTCRTALLVAVGTLLCCPVTLQAQHTLGGSLQGQYSPGVERHIRGTHVAHPAARGGAGRLQPRTISRTVAPRSRSSAATPTRSATSRSASHVESERVAERTTATSSRGAVRQATAEVIMDDPEQIEPIPMGVEGGPVYMDHGSYFDGHGGDCCGAGDCGGCVTCRTGCLPCLPFRDRLWVRGEYLLWWTKGMSLPPLVTTSPDDTARDQAGVLGEPGTEVLFGRDDLSDSSRSGMRFTVGWWLDCCRNWGLEFSYLGLEDETGGFFAQSEGLPILVRPFFNVENNEEDAELVAFPDLLSGSVGVVGSSEFESAEVLLRRLLYCCNGRRLDFLIGYRYARLDDQLRITENLVSEATNIGIEPGTTIDLYDDFRTYNDFNGVQLGVQSQWRHCNLTLDLLMKLGLGNTRSVTAIDGQTVTETPGGETSTYGGGLLAQPTNIGRYENNEFAVMPELGLALHYDFWCRWRASIGYTFLYWSNVMRAGEQIDLGVNTSQLPPGPLDGSPQPAFRGVTTDYWAQGLNFGLQYQF